MTPFPAPQTAHYREIAAAVAQRLAASRESAEPLAAWSEDVIVPSRGMAEAIGAEVLRLLPRGVAGLQIRFLEELATAALNDAGEFVRVASEAERRLAMRTAVRAVDHTMMEGRGVAAMLERSYRDLRDSGLTLAELTSRVNNTRGLRNAGRTRAIVRAFGEYERLIAALGAIDPAELLARAQRAITPAIRPQLLAGFYDMTGAQLRFVQTLGDRIAAICVPSDLPFASRFISAFGEPQAALGHRNGATTSSYDTHHAELSTVIAAVAALLAQDVPASAIAIVARSLTPYDARLINRLAEEQGFRTTLADEIPLPAHRLGRGAIALLRLRERGFLRGDVLELVRDGLHTRTHIDTDRTDYETRRQRVAGGTSEELAPLRNRSRALDDYLALVAELEELTAADDLVDRLPSLFRVETETDLAAAAQLDEIASLFRRAGVWNRGTDVASVIDAISAATTRLSRAVEQPPHPPSAPSPPRGGEGPGVWAGDVMRFRGRSFEHVFVVRMQDDVFPQRRTEDPLFPDSDRRLLGMREIGDGRDEEHLLLQLLLDSAAHVHFTGAAGDGFGKVLRPSRFLRQMPGKTLVAPDAKTRTAQLRPMQLLAMAGTRSIFDGYLPSLAETLRARLQAVSPTQLEDFGECPQKFLLKHVLGVEDIEHPERELQINHRDKGTIDHRILERFYRATPPAEIAAAAALLPHLPESMTERLDEIVDAQFDGLEASAPSFNRTIRAIERRATKRILREFLANDLADLAAQELVPKHFEYRFGLKHKELADHPEPFIVTAGGVPVRVEGTIDRIDAGAGKLRIVDYKSGKALRHANLPEKIDRGVRLQLALYAMAAAEFFDADPATVSATIRPLVLGDVKPRFAFELAEKKDGLLETLTIFLSSIQRGVFPAFPEDQEFNSCKYCPVNHSCRTRHDQEERYAVQQHRDPRTLLG